MYEEIKKKIRETMDNPLRLRGGDDPFPIKSCSNCVHWKKFYNSEYGKCTLSTSSNESMRSACGLITREGFVCKLHDKKQ